MLYGGGDVALLRPSCWRIVEAEVVVVVKGESRLVAAGSCLEVCEAAHCIEPCAAQLVLLAISLTESGSGSPPCFASSAEG